MNGGQIYTSAALPVITVAADSGVFTASNFATGISAGPLSESGQTVSFTVTNDNKPLFSVEPTIAADGTFTFTPSGTASGTATVTVVAQDSGGTAYGGVDTSAPQTFTITITPAAPTVTLSTASLASNVSTLTISGTGFSATPAENSVVFTPAGSGTVTAATATSLTVTGLTGLTPGPLNVVVTVNGLSSGAAVQVATVFLPVAGEMDPLNLNLTGSYVMATAVQADGKTLIAGSFSSVLGQARGNIARLNADGSLDAGFDPKANGEVACVAVQADGKILLGGLFTTLQPNGAASAVIRNRIARLNADGTLDMSFDPNAGSAVRSVVVQADGKILLGGGFTSLKPNGVVSAFIRSRIARLYADGTLDESFDPKANGEVACVAVQADGKILLGGFFTTLQPNGAASATSRSRIARLNADGTLDLGFDPKASNTVSSIALQVDGKVLLGGTFTNLQPNGAANPTPRQCIVRLNADGTLDTGFDPKASHAVNSMALQVDGKILLGGAFTTLQPNGAASATSRNRIARLNADGTLDTGFDPKADNVVYSVAVQADGKVLLGGFFTSLQPNGAASATARNRFAALVNDPATQTLSALDATQVSWTRNGSAPEVSQVTLEKSTDNGVTWTLLGNASRVGTTSHWLLTGQSLPASGQFRARGRTIQGYQNGGSGLIEQVASFSGLVKSTDTILGSTVGRALWRRPEANGSSIPNSLSTSATATPYEVVAFSVTASGNYTLAVTSISPSGWDNYLLLYVAAFTPASPLTNVLIGDDDDGPGLDAQVTRTLQAGTLYYAVITGYDNFDTGSYSLKLQGPGFFSERPVLAVEQPVGSGIVSGSTIYFDDVSMGATGSKTFTLKNSGDGDLTVLSVTMDGVDASQFNLPTPPVNQTIGPGGSFTFTAEFKPTSTGRKTATLHVNSSDPLRNPFDIHLSGNGLPDIVVEQPAGVALTAGVSSLNFGTLTTGGTSTLSFRARNGGFSALTGLSLSIIGAAPGDFTLGSLGASTLPPGGSTTFDVNFSPTALGVRTATLRITSNDAVKSPFDVALSGTGYAFSEFASTTVGRPAWDRPNANGNAAPVFISGVVAPYDTIGFTVTSSGTYTLTSTATNPAGWDTYLFLYSTAFDAAAPLNQVLIGDDDAAGGYNSRVSYTLQAGVTYYAVVTAYSSNQAGDYTLRISGPGNVVVVPNMAVIDSLGVNIPDGGSSYMTPVTVGGSTSSSYTIRNYGYTDLTGLGMTLDGVDAGSFSMTTQPTAPVAGPNGSTTFSITFSPTSAGMKRAVLHITSNDPNKSPFDIQLTGNGTPAIAIEQPTRVRLNDGVSNVGFGSVLLGNSQLLTFTIRSVGSAALNVTGSSVDGANAADFSVQNLTPGLLAPGTSSTFQVRFEPSSTGTRTAMLHLASNDPLVASFDIVLSGSCAPRSPTIDVGVYSYGYGLTSGVSTISFGAPLIGSSSSRTVYIRNYGTADLTGLSASTTGAHASEFSVGPLSSTPLSPFGSRSFEVTFAPAAAGLRTAVLRITSNDPLRGTFDINLVGNNSDWFFDLPRTTVGCPTWNRPNANGAGVPTGLSIPATATPFDVVSFSVNTTGEYSFRCTGTTPLDWNVYLLLYRDAFDPSNPLLNVVIGDDDSAGGYAAGFTSTLQAGTRYFIVITGGDNASYGLYNLEVSGPDNAMLEPQMLIEQPANRGIANGGSSYFGPAAVGESIRNTFTIRNVGYANLTGLSLSLEGRDVDQFSITQNPLPTISGPSGSASFVVNFSPTSLGQKNVILHIASNDPNANPFDINLIGNAAPGSADLTALTTSASGFTPVFAGTTTSYTATVPSAITSTTVTATRANATLQVRVNGGSYTALTSGVASGPLALNSGINIIEVRVTSQDGFTIKTYTLTVTRAVALPAAGDVEPLNPAIVGGNVYATALQPDGKTIIAGSFTSVLGQPRNNIARLNANGTLDAGFNPNVNGSIYCVAVQADGKILLGGGFSTVGGVTRNRIARVAANGTLDTGFNPNANNLVYCVAVQEDGKILLGGNFTTMSGSARNNIARLDAGGGLDTGFSTNTNGLVNSMAVQADGRILLGGGFSTVNGTARNNIARLDAAGGLDTGFNPNTNGFVNTVAVQADGKILLGGQFTSVGGVTRSNIARLDAAGALETGFNPNAGGPIHSLALQADGKILLGGSFTTISGIASNRIARLDDVGTLDAAFNPNASGTVNSVSVQADGKILLGGQFTSVGGITRNLFARLINEPATQTLSAQSTEQITWTRGGSSPEVSQVTFEQSTDSGATWTLLGRGGRMGTTANWQLNGISLPYSGQIRARGRFASGYQNGGSGLLESVAGFSFPPTVTAISPPTGTTFGGTLVMITGTNFNGTTGVTIGGVAATNVAVTSSTSLFAVTPANVAGEASVQVTTPGGTNVPNTLYTYFVPSNNADLSALSITTAALNEVFAANTVAYTADAPNATTSVTITPTVAQANATIQARLGTNAFAPIISGTPSASFALAVGLNTIEIKVTAQDETTTKTYIISLTRAEGPKIVIRGNNRAISSGDDTPNATDHTYFGTVAISSGVVSRTFTIANTAAAVALNLTGTPIVQISGAHAADFRVSSLPSAQVAGSSSTTFQVSFDPSGIGLRTAMLSIDSDDLDETPYTLAISGNGRITGQNLQTLVFTPPSKLYLAESPFTLSASTNSGLPVTYSVVSGPATVIGDVLTLTSAGTVKVRASQPGDGDFLAAVPVERSITVAANPTTMTLTNLSQTFTGTPRPITVLGATGAVVTYNGSLTVPIFAGSYAVKAVLGGNSKTGTLVITKAPLFVTPDDQRKFAGQVNPVLTFGYHGFLGVDNPVKSVDKAPTISTTATAASVGGLYLITANGGSSTNYFFVYQTGIMMVETFAASYEALLAPEGSQRPSAKLELTVAPSSKTFTGKLTTPKETVALSFAGTLKTNPNETATASVEVKRGLNTYLVEATLPLTGDFTSEAKQNAVSLGKTLYGKKLLTLAKGQTLSYIGTHSALLAPATGGLAPAGAGWAVATIDAKGLLKLAGKLADGTGLTASLAADVGSDPSYRLFLQPYTPARTGAFLAGDFQLKQHPDHTGRRFVAFEDEADLTWEKAPRQQDTSYRTGFGPVDTRFTLDPWLPPVAAKGSVPAITLAQRLRLSSPANSLTVKHSAIRSDSFANLPISLAMNAATNAVSVLAPAANTTKWKVTLTPATGAFVGSFELNDGGKKRSVPFAGMMRQPRIADPNGLIGDGNFQLPSLFAAPDNEILFGEVGFER